MSWTQIDETIGRGILGDRGHSTAVRWTASNDGSRPFRVYCTCGWVSSMHATRDAARRLGDEHVEQPGEKL